MVLEAVGLADRRLEAVASRQFIDNLIVVRVASAVTPQIQRRPQMGRDRMSAEPDQSAGFRYHWNQEGSARQFSWCKWLKVREVQNSKPKKGRKFAIARIRPVLRRTKKAKEERQRNDWPSLRVFARFSGYLGIPRKNCE